MIKQRNRIRTQLHRLLDEFTSINVQYKLFIFLTGLIVGMILAS